MLLIHNIFSQILNQSNTKYRGKFGEVKKCKEKSTGRFFAAKFVSVIREQDKKDVLNEIEIMKSLQHPRLIQLYDVYESKKQICLIMEL